MTALVKGCTAGSLAAWPDEPLQPGLGTTVSLLKLVHVLQAEATLGSKLDILGKDGPEGAAALVTSDATLCPAVCNAGINIRKKAVEYSEEEYRTVMSINLDACFRLSQVHSVLALH